MTASVLVTGAAGFIGAHLAASLADAGHTVTAMDNFHDSGDLRLKHDRVAALLAPRGIDVARADCGDGPALTRLMRSGGITHVAHLAALASVTASQAAPREYVASNVEAFATLLHASRAHGVRHVVYASSSSVYGAGGGRHSAFREADDTSHPASVYAATKKADEIVARSAAVLHGQRSTGLRFFTVYGPWGRPDMAPTLFAHALRRGQALRVFAQGRAERDFVYVDDAVRALSSALFGPDDTGADAADAHGSPHSPPMHRVYNVGNPPPVGVADFADLLARHFGLRVRLIPEPLPAGDVARTSSDVSLIGRELGWSPRVRVADGVGRFAEWFGRYYGDAGTAGKNDRPADGAAASAG